MMKRFFYLISAAAVLICVLAACGSKEPQAAASRELRIDLSTGKKLSYLDSHGGFHGDGMTYLVLSFFDDGVLEQTEKDSQWKALPLDETADALAYGSSGETDSFGPVLTDAEGSPLLPEIENGYYRLIDRQTGNQDSTGVELLRRASYNLTLAVYDTDADLLYFCRLDT